MRSFPLKIVTPDGVQFDGSAEQLIVRTTGGDAAILARHIDYVTPLGMGKAAVIVEGQKRYAACIGGMVSVADGCVTLLPTTFEWEDKIDAERAEKAKHRAEAILSDKSASDTDVLLAKARLKRALVRTSVVSGKVK